MNKYLNFPIAISTAFLFFTGMNLSLYRAANAVEVHLDNGSIIELDDQLARRCGEEGISLAACACWIDIILEEEGDDSISEEDIDDLSIDYQQELADCMDINE
ncbi:MAG: hypothetical protein AB4290_10800 [Spirulina sp.]